MMFLPALVHELRVDLESEDRQQQHHAEQHLDVAVPHVIVLELHHVETVEKRRHDEDQRADDHVEHERRVVT